MMDTSLRLKFAFHSSFTELKRLAHQLVNSLSWEHNFQRNEARLFSQVSVFTSLWPQRTGLTTVCELTLKYQVQRGLLAAFFPTSVASAVNKSTGFNSS